MQLQPNRRRKRILDPVDRISESLLGLIFLLGCAYGRLSGFRPHATGLVR